jgi:alkylation response protein AidB-like acyl-CoA dehydrogenase
MWDEVTEVEFRGELRSYLTEHHPGPEPADALERLNFQRAWAARLADDGWAAPAWPRRYGGMDLPLDRVLAYHEEVARARVPAHPSPNAFIVGPTLLVHGTDEQRDRFVRPIVRAAELWCQGFSEPGAGSDLAALRTRAEPRDNAYVVNGQKVWTSKAMTADWMFALVRTSTSATRHRGITYLLIDMRSPGITVRPLRDLTGGSWFGEVFLDNVVVPFEQRVGAEDDGWRLARHSLGHERSTSRVAQVIRYERIVEELIALARSSGRADDPLIRQQLADVVIGCRLLKATFERVMARVLRGEDPGPASSISRLFLATFEQRLHEVGLRLLGTDGLLASDEPAGRDGGRWIWGFLNTRASTIGAGTSEVQRSTIAEQVLGLPR